MSFSFLQKINTMRNTLLILLASAAAFPAVAGAQTASPLTSFRLTTANYTQNFDSLATSGTSNSLPAGFQIVESGTGSAADGMYAAATGSANGGTAYSFGSASSTDRALGSIASGTVGPIMFGGVFTNGLTSNITSLSFGYFGEQWRQGTTTDPLTFEYSTNATSLDSGTWVRASELDFAALLTGTAAALDGNAAGNRALITGTISGLSIGAGGNFGFRWTDINGENNDAGLGIDNLNITAGLGGAVAPAPAVPEPATWGLMVLGLGMTGGALRRRQGRQRLAIA